MDTPNTPADSAPESAPNRREQELQQIRDALRGLRFGSVNVVVQDGVVVQIDRTEKRRLPQSTPSSS
jgi:hypothetical protein